MRNSGKTTPRMRLNDQQFNQDMFNYTTNTYDDVKMPLDDSMEDLTVNKPDGKSMNAIDIVNQRSDTFTKNHSNLNKTDVQLKVDNQTQNV